MGWCQREVRRVVTPGTVVEPSMLDAGQANYLAAICMEEQPGEGDDGPVGTRPYGLSYCDITTGEFWVTQVEGQIELEREFARIQPRELLAPDLREWQTDADASAVPGFRAGLLKPTLVPPYRFAFTSTRQTLLEQFHVSTLAGFDLEDKPLAVRAAGAILHYLRETQPAALNQLTELRTYSTSQFMGLDAVTRRNPWN